MGPPAVFLAARRLCTKKPRCVDHDPFILPSLHSAGAAEMVKNSRPFAVLKNPIREKDIS
jgi:hypothetical protein